MSIEQARSMEQILGRRLSKPQARNDLAIAVLSMKILGFSGREILDEVAGALRGAGFLPVEQRATDVRPANTVSIKKTLI